MNPEVAAFVLFSATNLLQAVAFCVLVVGDSVLKRRLRQLTEELVLVRAEPDGRRVALIEGEVVHDLTPGLRAYSLGSPRPDYAARAYEAARRRTDEVPEERTDN